MLPPNIVSKIKDKRKLRREFTKTKDIALKRKLNKLKKEIKKETKIERDTQWEKKFKKVKISSNAEDWKEIKIS